MANVIDALIAEALGEGPEGIAAVAHVINQRAMATGKTPEQIVNEASQFSGVSNPGRSVAASMKDPAVRAQVSEIWDGVQNGSIPNPFPGASYFHTPEVNPSWASAYDRAGQLGNHIFYIDPKTQQASAQNTASIPTSSSERPQMADWLAYDNQNATRNQPLSPKLVDAMSFLPSMGVSMKVHSGGQDSSGPNRVGSTRHDHGNAGDVDFYQNGRKLDWNNAADLPILSSIVSQAKANGVTGIGAGDDYMGAGRFHIGFGNPGVWGAGGKGATAPSWLKDAYYNGGAPIMATASNKQATQPKPQGKGIFGTIAGLVPTGFSLPQLSPETMRGVQRAVVGPMMGTVAGRTALARMIFPSNIGPAPSVSQGWSGQQGTQAYAVNSGGSAPVMLSGSGYNSSPAHEFNRDVYRANSAAVGGVPLTQSSINQALSSGKTLYKLA